MTHTSHKQYKHCHQPKTQYEITADVKIRGASVCSPCDKPKVQLCNLQLKERDCSSSSSSSSDWSYDKKKKSHKKHYKKY